MGRWPLHILALALSATACKGNVGAPADTTGPGGTGLPSNPSNPNNPNNPNNPDAGPSGPIVAPQSPVRRLSQAELDNVLLDLLQDSTNPAGTFIQDEFAPYDNDPTTQVVSASLIDSVEALADTVIASLLGDTSRRDAVIGCTPTGPDDAECLQTFVERFGRAALRRPLTTDEVASYMTLQAYATEDNPYVDNDFYTAAGLVIRTLLQDPEFLYRIEAGTAAGASGLFNLDLYEIASRMSFLILGTTPDETLLQDAEQGRLATGEGRRAVANRLLSDPRARTQLNRFHSMWLGYRTIPHGAQLVSGFNLETTKLIEDVIFDAPRSYLDVFTSNRTYLTASLAQHYGLPEPDGGEGWVSYDGTDRAGIMSHGSVLAAFSKFTDTSPTQRGILVRTRLMCQKIAPPPPNVDVDQPPGGQDADACKVDRYQQHFDSPSCHACHSQMDPIGFGLENYDIAGRFRDHDDGRPDCPIDGLGNLPDGTEFRGPRELVETLVERDFIDACAVQQFYHFAVGYEPTSTDTPLVDTLTDTFRSQQHDFQSLILDYVSSDEFAERRAEDS